MGFRISSKTYYSHIPFAVASYQVLWVLLPLHFNFTFSVFNSLILFFLDGFMSLSAVRLSAMATWWTGLSKPKKNPAQTLTCGRSTTDAGFASEQEGWLTSVQTQALLRIGKWCFLQMLITFWTLNVFFPHMAISEVNKKIKIAANASQSFTPNWRYMRFC